MQLQALPLAVKIEKTKQRIREWVNCWGEDGVYLSFSGGKDSTVLADIIDSMGYSSIPLVYVDTGLEYPEIRSFVKSYGDRVVWLKPEKTFKQVIDEHGYPFISKEVSDIVSLAKRGFKSGIDKLNGVNKDGEPDEFRKRFAKWKFMVDSPYDFSDECCNINKKKPVKHYEKESGRKPILGTMAAESSLRAMSWLRTGCNSFEGSRPMSRPMSFWTENDVLKYLKINNIPIASVYGDIIPDCENTDATQMSLEDLDPTLGLFELNDPPLTTSGCKRTGCVFCGFGCNLKGDERFVRLKQTHPKIYDYIMRSTESGGLGYQEIIDWLNKNGNLNIKY